MPRKANDAKSKKTKIKKTKNKKVKIKKKKKNARKQLMLIMYFSDDETEVNDPETEFASEIYNDEYSYSDYEEEELYEDDIGNNILNLTDDYINFVADRENPMEEEVNKLIDEIRKRTSLIYSIYNAKSYSSTTNNNNYNSKHNNATNYHDSCKLIGDDGEVIEPKINNYKCWYCNCDFDWFSYYMPNRYEKGVYHVFGNFCSFQCMSTYNNKRLNDNKQRTRGGLIKKMYYDATGKEDDIPSAGDPELLKEKGGPLTVDEYRNKYEIVPTMTNPPSIKYSPLVHVIRIEE